MNDLKKRLERTSSFRNFLRTRQKERDYVILDPSTYAAEFSGKKSGYPTFEDNMAFHKAFENDSPISAFVFPDEVIPELKWNREVVHETAGEVHYRETINVPGSGIKERLIAEAPGTQPWIIKAPVREESDFDLIDYYAECVRKNTHLFTVRFRELFQTFQDQGFMAGIVLLTAFEVYYLIDYPDMPLFYYDYPERYLNATQNVYKANIALAEELMKAGCEIFYMGSAGMELLSPRIFDEAIIPYTRQTTDFIRDNGGFSSYHICGHSYQLLQSGRINQIRPTWFETFSSPPCGNNPSLSESLRYLDDTIISKGNLALELLRNGTTDEVKNEALNIRKETRGRNHIIGQADATILNGTPEQNIRALLKAAID